MEITEFALPLVPSNSASWHLRSWRIVKLARHRSLPLRAGSQDLPHGYSLTGAPSQLADANEGHDWRTYVDFAQHLIAQARTLYAAEDLGLELSNMVYTLDFTTIDLCLALFPWALFAAPRQP